MQVWKTNVHVITETVKAARDFLNGELAKYNYNAELNKAIKFDNEQAFSSAKTKGVGQTTILKFLGIKKAG